MFTYDLQLRKSGILVAKEWDVLEADYIERVIDNEDVVFHLEDSICLDKNVILKDLFLFISAQPLLWATVTSCLFLEELIEESSQEPCCDSEITFLELAWKVFNDSDMFEEASISESGDFHGVGLDGEFGIEFTPINELVSLPIMLDDRYIIRDGEGEEIFSTRKKFTLGKMIKEIVLELSFVGSPKEKATALGDLQNRLKSIDYDKCVPWEEVEKKINDEKNLDNFEQKNIKPCKVCKKDARSPHFNKPNDLCIKCFKKMKEN